MSVLILLDTGPLGMLANPKGNAETQACQNWAEKMLEKGVRLFISEIADYEVRRELLRARKTRSIERLDVLQQALEYAPLNTPTMLKAAEFWAQMRHEHRPTAHEHALDADVILAAQAVILGQNNGSYVVIATTNVHHLSRMVEAHHWQEIG